VDLHEVRLDRPIQAQVAVELVGSAKGVGLGGLMSQIIREVNVEALPMAMPDRFEIDVSHMDIGDQIHVSDLAVPEGATILDDPESVLATVAAPRKMELPEEEEGEEGVEGEEGEPEEGGAEAASEASDEAGSEAES
jgi:large subunit ribosomal protein L25